MIDSNNTKTLYDAIHQFREHIIQNHGSESDTAQAYICIADGHFVYPILSSLKSHNMGIFLASLLP